jgi:hypothetical protein
MKVGTASWSMIARCENASRTTTFKYFLKPFLSHKYKSHHDGQHAESWALYKAATKKDKQHFFDNKIKVANTLHQYMDLDSDILTFMINASIVNTIIGDMFFRDDKVVVDSDDADDDDVVGTAARKAAKKLKEKTNAMKLFILNEVDEDEDDLHLYTITIKNIMRFNLVMDHIGSGMSFRQTASAIQHAKECTKTAKLAGITNLMVGQYIRILVGSTLQQIADYLDDESVWAMSLAGNGSTHRGQSFFDLCVRICFRGWLLNLHLVVIPMFDCHTADNIFNMLVKFCDALYGKWRAKLIGMSSDDENMMIGCHIDLVTRMIACAENLVLHIWCALHQIDLVVKSATEELADDEWIIFAWSFSIFLRA